MQGARQAGSGKNILNSQETEPEKEGGERQVDACLWESRAWGPGRTGGVSHFSCHRPEHISSPESDLQTLTLFLPQDFLLHLFIILMILISDPHTV